MYAYIYIYIYIYIERTAFKEKKTQGKIDSRYEADMHISYVVVIIIIYN